MTGRIAFGFLSVSRAVAVLAVSALTVAAVPPQDVADAGPPAVRLTAQTAPMPTAMSSVDNPIGRQVRFHAELAVEFVVTGAQLTERIVAVPGALVRDVRTGAPLPATLRTAAVTLAVVEFDAGRKLVGYARDYTEFQIRFVTDALAALPGPLRALVAAGSALTSEFVQRVAAAAIAVVDRAQPVLTGAAAPAGSAPHVSAPAVSQLSTAPAEVKPHRVPKTVKPAMQDADPGIGTVRAHGQVRRSAISGTTRADTAPIGVVPIETDTESPVGRNTHRQRGQVAVTPEQPTPEAQPAGDRDPGTDAQSPTATIP